MVEQQKAAVNPHHEAEHQHHTEHHSEHHPEHHPEHHKQKVSYWIIATAILVVLLVASIWTQGFKFSTLSKDEAAQNAITYINEKLLRGQGTATLVSAAVVDNLYALKISVNGQIIDSYVTKDGKLFFPQALNLLEAPADAAATTPPANLPKSDKPKVELFVMSHCPYGTQAEKGLLPVIGALGDKADIEIKFVYYAMHGQAEISEEMNQICIKNEQKTKFYDYLKCFLKDGDGKACLTTAKVDTTKMAACVKKLDTQYQVTKKFNDQTTWLSGRYPLFDVYKEDNTKYQIGGSPTLIVNGAQAESARSPGAYLATICGAFNTAPAECQQTLSSQTYSAGFGYEIASADASAVAQCG